MIFSQNETDIDKLVEFRLEANVNTYAACMNKTDSTRLDSHDFTYSNGPYTYHDTYVGGERFAGEEAIWYEGKSWYAMNYMGRVLNRNFSGDFLKEALRKADKKMPFRGPEYYQSGQYIYKCNVAGDFTCFAGLFCVRRIDLFLCGFCRVKGGFDMAQISVENLTFAYEGSFDEVFTDTSFSIDTDTQ